MFGLSGCGLIPLRLDTPTESVELRDTPFFAQTEYHCGPAALATVLGAQGRSVTPDQLVPLIYTPGREGSLQAEMIAATRRHERLPLRVEARPEALVAALHAGYPVLVLQNLGLARWPTWHYAVVVGYEPQGSRFVLRSGTEPRATPRARSFVDSWSRAERWGFVAAQPDTVPPFATVENWLAAAAPFESRGKLDIAEVAYRAALTRWPESALAWQAFANARYAAKDARGAEDALREAVRLAPQSAAARNNLASLLLARGCVRAARGQLDALTTIPDALRAAIEDTLRGVEAAPGTELAGCPRHE
ncbi:MAG: PA2778 family cysteine peptidase [Panacagrimonas sp.]